MRVFGVAISSYQNFTKAGFIAELQSRVGKGYMPSAKRESYQHKPEYFEKLKVEEYLKRPYDEYGPACDTDYYVFADSKDVWFQLVGYTGVYLINLTTLDCWYCNKDAEHPEWVVWEEQVCNDNLVGLYECLEENI